MVSIYIIYVLSVIAKEYSYYRHRQENGLSKTEGNSSFYFPEGASPRGSIVES